MIWGCSCVFIKDFVFVWLVFEIRSCAVSLVSSICDGGFKLVCL